MNREWLTSPYGFVIFICLGYLANTTALALADTYAFIRWLKQRRSRPDPVARTPVAMIQRLPGRTSHHEGPHMPDESEIRRYGRGLPGDSTYGPRHIEQPPTLHSVSPQPGPTRPSPDRRGLVAGAVAAVVTLLVLGAIGGAYLLGHRSSAGSTPTKAAAQDLSANADGCREFDRDLNFMHQSLIDATPAPVFISMGAEDLRDKVPVAADLTTGETKAAMLRVSTFGKILIDKEREFMQPGFDDSTELGGLRDAYATVYGLCSRAGVTLKNAI